MQEAAAERKNGDASKSDERHNHIRAGHGQNGGEETDDLLASTLQGLNLADRSRHDDIDDDEPQLNFKEHALIPDNYLKPAPGTDRDNPSGPVPPEAV